MEFTNDMLSFIILTGRWCDIFLNVHAPPKVTSDDMKDRVYDEPKIVFNKFPENQMKILLGEFSAN
jgi:hypothetical protein